MKTAFISDIHGNYEALQAVLSEIDRLGVTHIYCAGDVVGYYSQINECCSVLQEREIPCVMGNHDWYMAGGGFCPRSRSVNDCLAYQRTIIEPQHVEWLRSFPVQRDIGEVRMVHGGWADPIDEYLKPSAEYFEKVEGRVFVSGHAFPDGAAFRRENLLQSRLGGTAERRRSSVCLCRLRRRRVRASSR
jgi:predicted phosphodiesterase